MAFVGRRNNEGKLVDCKLISGMGTSSMPISDLSDEDTDSGTLKNYSSRSYVSPTVRYVANKGAENEDIESSFTYKAQNADIDSTAGLGECYDREKSAEEAYDDYQSEIASDEETFKCGANSQLDDLDSIDGDTMCSPADTKDIHGRGSLGCKSTLRPEDTQSLSSVDSSTYCRRSIQPEDAFSLDSLGSSLADLANSTDKNTGNACQLTNRTYDLKASTVRREDCSSASTCSWTDMYGGALKKSEGTRSNIVPSLSLNLSTNSSSGSSTFFRSLDESKERHNQEVYCEWMKRKERQLKQKQLAEKQEKEKRDAEDAERKLMAKKRYAEWCKQKTMQQKKDSTVSSKNSADCFSNYSGLSRMGSLSQSSKKPQPKETPEDRRKRLEEWERVKARQEKREHERQLQEQQRRESLEQERRHRSEGAYSNWMKSVGKRAKPVPLNQGFDTLRGTISNIYVNPVEWVSNIDHNESRGN